MLKKYKARQKNAKVEPLLEEQFETARLLGNEFLLIDRRARAAHDVNTKLKSLPYFQPVYRVDPDSAAEQTDTYSKGKN